MGIRRERCAKNLDWGSDWWTSWAGYVGLNEVEAGEQLTAWKRGWDRPSFCWLPGHEVTETAFMRDAYAKGGGPIPRRWRGTGVGGSQCPVCWLQPQQASCSTPAAAPAPAPAPLATKRGRLAYCPAAQRRPPLTAKQLKAGRTGFAPDRSLVDRLCEANSSPFSRHLVIGLPGATSIGALRMVRSPEAKDANGQRIGQTGSSWLPNHLRRSAVAKARICNHDLGRLGASYLCLEFLTVPGEVRCPKRSDLLA